MTVAIFAVAAQMVLVFPSTVEAQHRPMADPESVGMSSDRFERLDAAMQRYIDAATARRRSSCRREGESLSVGIDVQP